MDRAPVGSPWFAAFVPHQMASALISLLLPLVLLERFRVAPDVVGAATAVVSMTAVPSSVLWGYLCDHTERRRVYLVIGFSGLAVSSLLFATASSIGSVLLFAALYGFFGVATAPVATVLIMETRSPDELPVGIGAFNRAGGGGWLAGLLFGAVWFALVGPSLGEDASLQLLFVVAGLLSVAGLVLILRLVHDQPARFSRTEAGDRSATAAILRHHPVERPHYVPARLHRHFRPYDARKVLRHAGPAFANLLLMTAGSTLLFCGFSTFYTAFPIYLHAAFSAGGLGLSKSLIFAVYMASSLGAFFAYVPSGRAVHVAGPKRVHLAAVGSRLLLMPAFLLTLSLRGDLLVLLAGLALLHVAMGVCWAHIAVSGTSMVQELTPVRVRGEMQGVYSALQGIGTILGAFAGGFAAHVLGFSSSFLIATGMVAAGGLLIGLIRRHEQRAPAAAGTPTRRTRRRTVSPTGA